MQQHLKAEYWFERMPPAPLAAAPVCEGNSFAAALLSRPCSTKACGIQQHTQAGACPRQYKGGSAQV